jgi:hypothetical protein
MFVCITMPPAFLKLLADLFYIFFVFYLCILISSDSSLFPTLLHGVG